MLIELEEWEKSVQVLDGLIEEDDQIVDTWYRNTIKNKITIFTAGQKILKSLGKKTHEIK